MKIFLPALIGTFAVVNVLAWVNFASRPDLAPRVVREVVVKEEARIIFGAGSVDTWFGRLNCASIAAFDSKATFTLAPGVKYTIRGVDARSVGDSDFAKTCLVETPFSYSTGWISQPYVATPNGSSVPLGAR